MSGLSIDDTIKGKSEKSIITANLPQCSAIPHPAVLGKTGSSCPTTPSRLRCPDRFSCDDVCSSPAINVWVCLS
jgi:hypothetical protein